MKHPGLFVVRFYKLAVPGVLGVEVAHHGYISSGLHSLVQNPSGRRHNGVALVEQARHRVFSFHSIVPASLQQLL